MKGSILVLEGLDGSGKSTQAEQLHAAMPSWKYITFPNYQSESGRIITQYLKGAFPETDAAVGAYSATSFYAIDRYLSFKQDWETDYRSGRIILSTRYTTSNAIYQMAKLPREQWDSYYSWLIDYEYRKLGLPKPDRVLYLDMPLAVSQQLLLRRYGGDASKKDLHERDLTYLQACREAALYLYRNDSGRTWRMLSCCREDGSLYSIAEVQKRVREACSDYVG